MDTRIKYRPEIDGLRAIAVISVILYHAQISFLQYQPFRGGFIGVDIFFVISGYLITSIIFKELIAQGSFSFKNFYERRIRRIIPVLLLVILTSVPFAWLYLLPVSFVDYSKSILFSLGFSSNFYFWSSGLSYGAESVLFKPFLHTWSLSVEEQFYILFPLIFFLIFKYFKKYLILFFITGLVISLSLAEWGNNNYPSFNFYILPTRAWEILSGSLLALCEIKLGHRSNNKIFNLVLPSVGIIAIFCSVLFFDDSIMHPSLLTVIPIVSVCLIIWFSHKDEFTTKILSSKIFVGLGLISYSLYLWHYPIFAFSRKSNFIEGGIFNQLIIYTLILLLSITSYFFIERVARDREIKFKIVLRNILFFSFLIISLCSFTIFKKGELNSENTYIGKQMSSPLYRSNCKYSSNNENFLDDNFFKIEFLNCKKKLGKFILVLGDSHGVDIFNALGKISNNKQFLIGLNKPGCRPLSKSTHNEKFLKCHYENALDFIKNNRENIKYVFFTHKGSYFLTNTGSKNQMNSSQLRKLPLNTSQIKNTISYINSIKEITQNVIFLGPHLEPNIEIDRNFIIDTLIKKKLYEDNTNYDIIKLDEELKIISKKNQIEYVSKIDALNFIFSEDFIIDSNLTFSDTDHWNEFGEVYFGEKLIRNSKIKKLLSF
tara:strand:+ start:877 stop:2850 length:1974 start_codon:yes stop_codon:yes gene_type:complete